MDVNLRCVYIFPNLPAIDWIFISLNCLFLFLYDYLDFKRQLCVIISEYTYIQVEHLALNKCLILLKGFILTC